ncbi:17790_t:CDS:2, partial [Cetraspora pellucida]
LERQIDALTQKNIRLEHEKFELNLRVQRLLTRLENISKLTDNDHSAFRDKEEACAFALTPMQPNKKLSKTSVSIEKYNYLASFS